MEHGPEETLEHAEHAQHAARDPFDRRVTVSIAIVAAVLAGVTMAGHRAHNETLLLNGEANKELSQMGVYRTDAANKYAFYQAKKNRGSISENFSDVLNMMQLKNDSEKILEKTLAKWKKQKEQYDIELPKMLEDARALEAKAKEHQERADKANEEGHALHLRADRFDIGELGLQLGVVLCSLAILRRSRYFWYAGIACSLLGLLVSLSGFFGWFMAHR